MKREQFWTVENVAKFKGFDVTNGEVDMDDSEYADYLTECYGSVTICGQTFDSGSALQELDPTAFSCGKSDHESQLDSELQDQLDREDSDDIEFIDGDEWELDDEEDEDESE